MLNETNQLTHSGHGERPSRVLLAYPEPAHERLARSFWASVTRHFGYFETISEAVWKFEMSSALHAISGSEASQARFVLIATDGALPDCVKGWFETSCTLQPGVPGVLEMGNSI